jgi:hypothetical protein
MDRFSGQSMSAGMLAGCALSLIVAMVPMAIMESTAEQRDKETQNQVKLLAERLVVTTRAEPGKVKELRFSEPPTHPGQIELPMPADGREVLQIARMSEPIKYTGDPEIMLQGRMSHRKVGIVANKFKCSALSDDGVVDEEAAKWYILTEDFYYMSVSKDTYLYHSSHDDAVEGLWHPFENSPELLSRFEKDYKKYLEEQEEKDE